MSRREATSTKRGIIQTREEKIGRTEDKEEITRAEEETEAATAMREEAVEVEITSTEEEEEEATGKDSKDKKTRRLSLKAKEETPSKSRILKKPEAIRIRSSMETTEATTTIEATTIGKEGIKTTEVTISRRTM